MAVFGLVAFLLVTSVVNFNDRIFQYLFSKPASRAQAVDETPLVDLKITYSGTIRDEVLDVPKNTQGITLSWTTTQNPVSCTGLGYGLTDKDESWNGPKDPKGGTFKIKKLNSNNPYVYTINCSNDQGDGSGDSVTINIGASDNFISPYITTFDIFLGSKNYDQASFINVKKGDVVTINWKTLNLATPYSICVVSGSVNKSFTSINGYKAREEIKIAGDKIFKYAIYCSNEHGFTKQSAAFFPE